MKIPITHYGRRELIFSTVLIFMLAVLTGLISPAALPWPQLALVVILLAVTAFFRDPQRNIPPDPNVLLAPADGKITDIVEVREDEFLKAPALRIGIFLSVFDVHLNRSPCPGRVSYIQAHPGKCINAMRAQDASLHNRSNCLGLDCPDHPAGKVMVKQITGAIARRIVCDCQIDDNLDNGQKFGMIKFGSRTELFIPLDDCAKILVKKGDTVRAGTTIMVSYPTSKEDNDR